MTHPTHSERALALRAEGRSYMSIARELGVGKATVYRWINPAYDEQSRATARAWKARNPGTCEICGASKSHDPHSPRCLGCVAVIADFRESLVVGMWEDGWTYSEIAAAMGWKDHHSSGRYISALREKGLIDYRQPDHWRVAA